MSDGGSVIACKVCKNACRLVIHGVLTDDGKYNLWQCEECGALFRELSS